MGRDRKQTRSGARVVLVLANSFMDNLIPLGVSLLSACLKKAGHEVRLFDTTFYKTRERTGDDARVDTLQVKYTNFAEMGIFPKTGNMAFDLRKLIDEFSPDLIGVSAVESTYFIGLRLLDGIKGSGIPTVIGGIHATFSPEDVIKENAVDMVCVGEGEQAIVELADRVRDNADYSDVPNLWVKDGAHIRKNPMAPLADLNKLPYQDWGMYEKERFYKPMGGKIYIAGTFEMNRGCPYTCAFCCNENLQETYRARGSYYREKDIDILMDEIKQKTASYGLQYLYIVAENFLMMKEARFMSFVESYKDVRLPFWIETRPDSVTKERLALLREIGCEGISIGVEHGNEQFREDILNRRVSNDAIVRAFSIAKDVKIRTCANNIVGFPTETREQIFDTIRLNREISADNIIVNIFTPYRGTRLRQLSVEKGYLDPQAVAGDYRMDADIRMPHLPPDRIRGLQRAFPMYVKFPEDMWGQIEKCEKFDKEGNETFEELRKVYLKSYMR